MASHIEFEREDDRRWIAEITSLPGVTAYGDSKIESKLKVEALAASVVEYRRRHAPSSAS